MKPYYEDLLFEACEARYFIRRFLHISFTVFAMNIRLTLERHRNLALPLHIRLGPSLLNLVKEVYLYNLRLFQQHDSFVVELVFRFTYHPKRLLLRICYLRCNPTDDSYFFFVEREGNEDHKTRFRRIELCVIVDMMVMDNDT
jgi:hypothetical protein